jgi:hypothetical protein
MSKIIWYMKYFYFFYKKIRNLKLSWHSVKVAWDESSELDIDYKKDSAKMYVDEELSYWGD